jgi:hypothetical protein
MKKKNYPYLTASDGLQALEAYKSSPLQYRTVLMGMYLPTTLEVESYILLLTCVS